MKARFALLAGLAALSAVVSLDAQSKAKPYAAKTSWGDPDLQGVWDYKTITPLERPAAMGDRQFLNDDEVARLEGNAAKRLSEKGDNTAYASLFTARHSEASAFRKEVESRLQLVVNGLQMSSVHTETVLTGTSRRNTSEPWKQLPF